ncbi:MAG: hypothetical protein JNN18_13065 [Rubrivivax sp.]|nr:hypothetical protein [Rubrivivax sp.]
MAELPIPSDEQLSSWARFMRALSPQGVMLLLCLGVGLVAVYGLYETRTEWVPLLWRSQPMQIATMLALAALAVGAAMHSLHRRLSVKLERTEHMLRDQSEREIALLRTQVQACDAERDKLRVEIASVRASSDAKIEMLQREVDSLRQRAG